MKIRHELLTSFVDVNVDNNDESMLSQRLFRAHNLLKNKMCDMYALIDDLFKVEGNLAYIGVGANAALSQPYPRDG